MMEKIRVEKILDAIWTKAKVEIIIPENSIIVKSKGFGASGEPVTTVGSNNIPIVGIAKGDGIIR